MKTWAHVADGAVREMITLADDLDPGEDIYTPDFAKDMVDVTAASPQPAQGWIYDGRTFTAPAPSTPAPVDLRAYAASARYAKETAGITVGNAPIATDRDSQGMITGAWAAAQINPSISVAWKTVSGWATINAAQIQAIATAVLNHVQACFAAEQKVDAAIAAGTITTTAQIDAAFAAVTA